MISKKLYHRPSNCILFHDLHIAGYFNKAKIIKVSKNFTVYSNNYCPTTQDCLHKLYHGSSTASVQYATMHLSDVRPDGWQQMQHSIRVISTYKMTSITSDLPTRTFQRQTCCSPHACHWKYFHQMYASTRPFVLQLTNRTDGVTATHMAASYWEGRLMPE